MSNIPNEVSLLKKINNKWVFFGGLCIDCIMNTISQIANLYILIKQSNSLGITKKK